MQYERRRGRNARQRGQTLVLFALMLGLAIIPGLGLILEAGNAYGHQRIAQNGVDAVANAGATVLAERLGGATRTDANVLSSMTAISTANNLTSFTGTYANVTGGMLASSGLVTTDPANAAAVGGGLIPPNAQGVRARASLVFATTIAKAMGMNSFTASADATGVTGALTGGQFLPVVFPVSMRNCDGTGALISNLDAPWNLSNPPAAGSNHPNGQEFIVPLCKTGGGSFMILDLDPTKTCYEEVINPSAIQFSAFPVDVATDNGNDCAKKVEEAVVDGGLQGKVVMIPVCDGDCSTDHGAGGTYHIIRIAAFFLDYVSYSNSPSNSACTAATSPKYGTSLVNIVGGNGSSSCLAGWFVRYITSGPVGTNNINNGEAIGVQLIK